MKEWLSKRNPAALPSEAMPPQLLLVCKLAFLVALADSYFLELDAPFLPFLQVLDAFHESTVYASTLRILFFAGGGMLLFNIAPKAGAALVGAVLLTHLLGTRLDFKNHVFITACIFLLCGLSTRERTLTLYRIQFALVYFGAALNKLLDPDWRDGRFFQNWLENRLGSPFLADIAKSTYPDIVYASLGWITIILEAVLIVLILKPELNRGAIWIAAAFHFSTTVFTGGLTFGFFVPMLIVAFVGFDRSRERLGPVLATGSDRSWLDLQERLKRSALLPFALLGLFWLVERSGSIRYPLQTLGFAFVYWALFPYQDFLNWINRIRKSG